MNININCLFKFYDLFIYRCDMLAIYVVNQLLYGQAGAKTDTLLSN